MLSLEASMNRGKKLDTRKVNVEALWDKNAAV